MKGDFTMLSVIKETDHESRIIRLNQAWRLTHELAYASIHNNVGRYLFWTSIRNELQRSIKKEYNEFYRHQLADRAQYNWHCRWE